MAYCMKALLVNTRCVTGSGAWHRRALGSDLLVYQQPWIDIISTVLMWYPARLCDTTTPALAVDVEGDGCVSQQP